MRKIESRKPGINLALNFSCDVGKQSSLIKSRDRLDSINDLLQRFCVFRLLCEVLMLEVGTMFSRSVESYKSYVKLPNSTYANGVIGDVGE